MNQRMSLELLKDMPLDGGKCALCRNPVEEHGVDDSGLCNICFLSGRSVNSKIQSNARDQNGPRLNIYFATKIIRNHVGLMEYERINQ
jgi:hypothetical protein